jgi:glutathione S-transferase
MRLYALPKSLNSRKVLALIHHLDLPVEIVALSVDDVQSDTFAAINPNRLAPALVDGDLALWESNAIGIHLAQGSTMLPSGPRLQSDMLRWLFWESTHFNKALGTIFFESVVRPQLGWGAGNQALIDDALEQAEKYLAVLDAHLKERPFILGESLSFVDFAVASAEPYRDRIAIDFDRFANLQRHYDFIAELPAWQKALGRTPTAAAA